MAYHTYHGLETRIVRIFNTYGPRRPNDGRVLPAFIGQALRGEDLTVFGDGSQTVCSCYVDDLVEGIYRLLLSDYACPAERGNPSEMHHRAVRRGNYQAHRHHAESGVQAPAAGSTDGSASRTSRWRGSCGRNPGGRAPKG